MNFNKQICILPVALFSLVGCVQKSKIPQPEHKEHLNAHQCLEEPKIEEALPAQAGFEEQYKNSYYVQVFMTRDQSTANSVLEDVQKHFPNSSKVNKAFGQFKVLIGPNNKSVALSIQTDMQKIKDYETSFLINQFDSFK